MSHDDIRDALRAAIQADVAPTMGGNPETCYCWPREVYDDYVIYEIEGPTGESLYRRSYSIDVNGNVTLGDAQRVRQETSYVPITESLRGATLIEAIEDSGGWNWRVQLIRAGTSLNGNDYPLPVLHAAAPAYRGAPVYFGRGQDHNPHERGFASVAGYITEASPNPHGLEGRFEINRGRADLREAVQHAFDVQARTGRSVMGFSHVVPHDGAVVEARKPRGYRVKAISKVESVDIVMTPAAGGGLIEPLTESAFQNPEEATMNLEQLLARYRAGNALSEAEWRFVQESLEPAAFTALLAEARPAPQPAQPVQHTEPVTPPAQPAEPNTGITEAVGARIAEIERRAQLAECRALLTTRLAESNLPQRMRTAVAADYDGRIFEASDLEARITRDREIAAELAAVRPTGLGAAPITQDQRTKHQHAMDGLVWGRTVEGVRPFLTLKEAYQAITGNTDSYIDSSLSRRVLQEARTFTGDDPLLAESVTTTTFGDVLGDSIRRRMMQEYSRPDRMTWQAIAPSFPVVDFRTFDITRWGGYGFLPVVNEGGTYQPLTSPGDEKAQDSLDKYGGLEDLTLEAIANDDMGLVRRIPVKLGYAAVDTLYNAIWNTTIKDNATASYDSTTLYHANHSNTGTAALDEAGLTAVRTAMRDQTEYGNASGLPLGEANTPRILAVPNELEITAYKLTQSPVSIVSNQNATTPNFFNNALRVIVVDSWTDANNWYAFADPSIMPALQVGFYQGREEPELFVQDAQNVGSVFTADKITWKIRHIWVVVVVEHRATYRQVVA